jgi:hypothetical protein
MPFIEEVLQANRRIYGMYHPRNMFKSMVMVEGIGCVFVGNVENCQRYIADNAYKYERQAVPGLTR